MPHRLLCPLVLFGLVLAVAAPTPAQVPAKRPLRHADYAAWRSIQGQALSPDGSVLVYALVPQEGDGETVIRHLTDGKEHRQPRGSQSGGDRRAPAAHLPHLFSPDSKFVLFPIYPSRPDSTRGKPPAVRPGAALGIMELPGGKVTRLENVRACQVPEEGASWLAYLRGPAPAAPPEKAAKTPPPPPAAGELVLRRLADGKERTFPEVTEFQLSRDGRTLVFAVNSKKVQASGVYAITPGQDYSPLPLLTGPGRYSRLTWDDGQRQLVFLRSITPKPAAAPPGTPAPRPEVHLHHWRRPITGLVALPPDQLERLAPSLAMSYARIPLAAALPPVPLGGLTVLGALPLPRTTARPAVELVCGGKPGLQPGYQLSDQEAPAFSLDGRRVYFSVAPSPPASPPGQPRAVVELWHYQDDYIQPMQKARYRAARTFRAVFHLADGSCRQLADEALSAIVPSPAGEWALGLDDRAHRRLVGIQEHITPVDAVLVNQRSGARRPLLRKQTAGLSFSPGGKYLLAFDGKDWHSLSVPDGKRVNLTGKLGVRFDNEQHDTAGTPAPYGQGGWTKDDTHVLLYDRHDVWRIAPDGSSARNLTAGLGRKTMTRLRVVQVDPRQRGLDPAQPLLLRAENERTRDTGFYRVALTGGTPTLLILGARNYSAPLKARKADRYLLTLSTFADYPDLYVADRDFREVKRVSHAGAQKERFVWGKAEQVRYRSLDGTPLQGVLVRPENFDPKKKYPLLVYIYERLSQDLHRFRHPAPGTSINPTFYASNGYLVLMPDIAYTVGQPGQSALKCVLPAVQAVVDKGCVDEKAIGLQGHSWGGYQTAYLITQTTRFKAAAAGAPVCNMTSAYGGVRWGTGLARQFQYERTQSRIGGSLWQYPGRFIENSPLFHAERIRTPLLMLHNDRDEAVPWQQGIEYYLALRRLGKEAYLFNYPGEGHGLRQRVNQMDYTVRMQQFFDHHLKGAAKPEWMAKGLPYSPPPREPQGSGPHPPGRR